MSKFKSTSKEILPKPERATPTLKSVRIIDDELHSLNSSISTYSLNSLEGTEHKSSSDVSRHVEENTIEEEEFDENVDAEKKEAEPQNEAISNIKNKEDADERKVQNTIENSTNNVVDTPTETSDL